MEMIRDLPAEYGESPQLFSGTEEYHEFVDGLPEEWDEYPDSETASLEAVVQWLQAMNEHGRSFVLRNAVISDDEHAAIRQALE